MSDPVTLREAANLALMYLRTGFIECGQCGHEVPTATLDAVWQIEEGLSTPTTPDEREAESRSYTTDGVEGDSADRVTQTGEEAVYVRFSDDGQHIRKWSRHPFDGGVAFRPSEGEGLRAREVRPGINHVIAEAKRCQRLVQGCLECNADDERRWSETIEWLEGLA